MEDKIEIDLPGKFNPEEEAILEYLYVNPAKTVGTRSLIKALKPEKSSAEQQQYTYEEIQSAIETLIAEELARGKRVAVAGRVCFEKLRLTQKGEVTAIKERKRAKKLVVTTQHIGGHK
jgi:hypothetical protein